MLYFVPAIKKVIAKFLHFTNIYLIYLLVICNKKNISTIKVYSFKDVHLQISETITLPYCGQSFFSFNWYSGTNGY